MISVHVDLHSGLHTTSDVTSCKENFGSAELNGEGVWLRQSSLPTL